MLEQTIKRIKKEPIPLLNISTEQKDMVVAVKEEKRGRKPRTQYRSEAMQQLAENVGKAVAVVKDTVKGSQKIGWMQYQAAVYNIDQVIGKARVKVEADISEKSFDRLLKIAMESINQLPEGTIEGEFKEIDVKQEEEQG